LLYEYEGKNISYLISSHYTDSSWGVDVEDHLVDNYIIEREECKIKIRGYEKPEGKEIRYSARYTYKGLEYVLIGVMDRSDFEEIVKELKFF